MGGMDTDQLYSVRWNEFHTSIITSFRHLLDQEDFIDVTIACDGQSFTAHKVVLSACSPYFRSLLKANPCQHPIVILRDVKKQEMEALLSFMYNGEVRINQEHLPEFLKTARSLQVRGLVDFTKENQPSSWGSSSVVPVDVVGKNKASDNLPSPPYKRQRNNSEQMTTQPLTPSSSYNADRDKDTPSLLVQALELNQSQSSQNKNAVDSSVTGHSSDEEDSNSGDSDGSHTVNDNTRSDGNQQNNDVVNQPQISQAQHSKLEPVDFLSSSGNNHDLHNTSISIEQQSRHSFPTSISSGVSIISSLQGLPGLLPGPSGIHNNSQENSYGDGGGPTMGCYLNATEPKPVCTECGRVYSSVSNLKQHIANVHSATPHWEPCPVCGKHFKTRQYLFNHLLQTHGIRQRGSRMHMHLPSGGGGVGGGGVGGGGGHHHHHNHHHHHPSHTSTIASSSSPLQAHSPSATISSCFSNASVVKPLMSHHADIKPLSHASVAAAAAAAASAAAAAAAADHNEQRQQQQQQQQHPPNSFVPPLPSSSSASVLNRLNNPDLSSQFYMLSKSAVTR